MDRHENGKSDPDHQHHNDADPQTLIWRVKLLADTGNSLAMHSGAAFNSVSMCSGTPRSQPGGRHPGEDVPCEFCRLFYYEQISRLLLLLVSFFLFRFYSTIQCNISFCICWVVQVLLLLGKQIILLQTRKWDDWVGIEPEPVRPPAATTHCYTLP